MHVSQSTVSRSARTALNPPLLKNSIFPAGTIKGCYGWQTAVEGWGSFHTLHTLEKTAYTVGALAPEKEVDLGEWLALEDIARSLCAASGNSTSRITSPAVSGISPTHIGATLTRRGENATEEELTALEKILRAKEVYGAGPLRVFEDPPVQSGIWDESPGTGFIENVRSLQLDKYIVASA